MISHRSAAWLWELCDAPARHEISVPRDMAVAEIERLALEAVARNLEGAPKKVIVVPGRIVNVVA